MKLEIENNLSQEKIKKFCKRYNIKKMSLFGSALRNELTSDSDIDILVEFDKENIPSYFDLYEMEQELSQYINGREVDIRTPDDLSRYFRKEVMQTAEVLYVQRWYK